MSITRCPSCKSYLADYTRIVLCANERCTDPYYVDYALSPDQQKATDCSTAPAVVGQVEGAITCPCMSIDDWLELEQLRKSKFKLFLITCKDLGLATLIGVALGLAVVTYALLPYLIAQGAEGAPLAGEVSAPSAINLGGQAPARTPSVPVGNTGTTTTGQGV